MEIRYMQEKSRGSGNFWGRYSFLIEAWSDIAIFLRSAIINFFCKVTLQCWNFSFFDFISFVEKVFGFSFFYRSLAGCCRKMENLAKSRRCEGETGEDSGLGVQVAKNSRLAIFGAVVCDVMSWCEKTHIFLDSCIQENSPRARVSSKSKFLF